MFVEPLSASLPPGPVWGALAGSDRHRQMGTGKNPGPHATGKIQATSFTSWGVFSLSARLQFGSLRHRILLLPSREEAHWQVTKKVILPIAGKPSNYKSKEFHQGYEATGLARKGGRESSSHLWEKERWSLPGDTFPGDKGSLPLTELLTVASGRVCETAAPLEEGFFCISCLDSKTCKIKTDHKRSTREYTDGLFQPESFLKYETNGNYLKFKM